MDAIEHRRFDFDEAVLGKPSPDRPHGRAAREKAPSRLSAERKVHVALPHAYFGVAQPPVFVRGRGEAFRGHAPALRMDAELAGAAAASRARNADEVAGIDGLPPERESGFGAVGGEHDLEFHASLAQVREKNAAVVAHSHNASDHRDGPRIVPHVAERVASRHAGGIGVDAGVDQARQLLPANTLLLGKPPLRHGRREKLLFLFAHGLGQLCRRLRKVELRCSGAALEGAGKLGDEAFSLPDGDEHLGQLRRAAVAEQARAPLRQVLFV